MRHLHSLGSAHLVAMLALAVNAQSVLVIPNGLTATEGSTTDLFPWGRGATPLRQ